MRNILWRKNFDIRRVDFNLPCEIMPGFGGLNALVVGKNIISKCLWVIENMDNTATYFPKKDLRELIQKTIDVILNNPDKVDRVQRKDIELNDQYFKYAKTLRKLDLKKLSNKQLLSCHKKLFNLQYLSHCWALPTTWFLDSDGEDYSKLLIKLLEERIAKLQLDINQAEAFSALTTPAKKSLAATEERRSMEILEWIQKTPALKHWFMSHTTEELVRLFPSLPKHQKSKILKHHYTWCWTPYTYVGPAYGIDYYLEVWRGLLHEDINPNKKIKNDKHKAAQTQKLKKQLAAQLQLSVQEKHWFNITADIVWLKGYRKDCYFHGIYVLDLLLAEMGRRHGLSVMQMKYLTASEVPKVLAGKDMVDEANKRMKFSVIYGKTSKKLQLHWSDKGIKIYTGEKAKQFLKKQALEKINIVKTDTLTGTCACPGAAKGVIKIINVPDEMGKMNQGDIMLSHTTFPALVPAMKKAAAIITEDGGITCHAAIVARELQTPCVVGCKNAIAILKDGDKVEVDANKGIVKKI